MQHSNSNGKKDAGRTDLENKRATISIDVPGADAARTVEAQYFIKNSDDGTVSIYLSDRSDGIDIQTHVTRCVIDRVDTHADKEDVCARCLERPVRLTPEGLCGPCHHLACPGCDTGHVGGYDGNNRCTEECGFFSNDDDPEIVTDGSIELTSGTEVLHAGEKHRVARVGATQCEIYQLGNGSRIVSIDAVELVPEVQG